jgi:phthalate 4,5-cis-dihydrodiol dehydrogenase
MESRQLRLAIIGLGRGFMLTLPGLAAHPGVRIVAAFDPRPDAAQQFSRAYTARAFSDLRTMLAASDIDAVYIASPHEFHAEQCLDALQAGKHVLVEKPMAINLREAGRMAEAALAAGRVLMVGPSHGLDAPVIRAAELIRSGELGRIRLVTALNFTDFLYRPRRPSELDDSSGGGVVFSQGAHQIDVVRRLVGQPIASIRSTTGVWDPARKAQGAYTAFLAFEGGAAATLTYSGYAHFDSDQLVGNINELGRPKAAGGYGEARRRLADAGATGEAALKQSRMYGLASAASPPAHDLLHHEHFGFLLASCERADLRLFPDRIEISSNTEQRDDVLKPPAAPRYDAIDAFIRAALGGEQPVQDAGWGVETVACCEAIVQSAALEREVTIDEIFQASELSRSNFNGAR